MDENELTKNEINKRRSLCVLFTAILLCLSSFISIKAEPLPFVIQNLIVILSAAVFGGVQTTGAVGLFLIAGALGLPVFAEGACGITHISTIRGSFLLGYFVASLIVGIMLKTPSSDEKTPISKIASACITGYAAIYLFPFLKIMDGGLSVFTEMLPKFLPYLAVDCVKCLITIPLVSILRPVAAKKLNQNIYS